MLDSLFEAFYVIGLITGSVIRALHTRLYKQRRMVGKRETVVDQLLLLLASLGLIVLPLFYVLSPLAGLCGLQLANLGWLGWSCGLCGGAVLLWRSHLDLGRNWSPYLEVSEDQSLVTQGVYQLIRHPMYAAHWLWGIAQALLLQNWIAGWALLVAFLPLYLKRVPREEQMMLERFGEKYSLYMYRTGRVLPPFWR